MALIYTRPQGDGIFDVLGKLIGAIEQAHECFRTHETGGHRTALDQYKTDEDYTDDTERAIAPMVDALFGLETATTDYAERVRRVAGSYLVAAVERGLNLASKSLSLPDALRLLIQEMRKDGQTVKRAAPFISAPQLSNIGYDGRLWVEDVGPDNAMRERMIGETLDVTCVSQQPVRLEIRSRRPLLPAMAHNWPGGSGAAVTLKETTETDGRLLNAGFELVDATGAATNWSVVDGSWNLHWEVTHYEVQSIVKSTMTTGQYRLKFQPPSGGLLVTRWLPYDADMVAVQAALRELPGLERVEITEPIAGAWYVHFVGVPGDLALLTVDNSTDGIFSINTITDGSSLFWRGRTLTVFGNDAPNRRIMQRIEPGTLEPGRLYFLLARLRKSAATTGGVLRAGLYDALDKAALSQHYEAGQYVWPLNENDAPIDDDLLVPTDGFKAVKLATFRVRERDAKRPMYFVLNVKDLASGVTLYIDDVLLVEGVELYPGGPLVVLQSGSNFPNLGASLPLTIAVDQTQGKWQKWFGRLFGGPQLPSHSSPTIPDSLIP